VESNIQEKHHILSGKITGKSPLKNPLAPLKNILEIYQRKNT
jgi:hypothetical protein